MGWFVLRKWHLALSYVNGWNTFYIRTANFKICNPKLLLFSSSLIKRSIMKLFQTLFFLLAITLLTFACNNTTEGTEGDNTTADSTTQNTEPEATPLIIDVSGKYTYDNGENQGNGELIIQQLGNGHFNFQLMIVGPGAVPNTGKMDGSGLLNPQEREGVATIVEFGGTCQLKFTFANNQAVVETLEGDSALCGFGNNVMADGTYTREAE